MNKRNLLLLKILLFLFALNSLSLCLYFTSHSRTLTPSQTDTQARHSLSLNRLPLTDHNRHPYRYSKPWPILPSYLPWSQTTQVPYRSCEAYFGNGFTNRVDLLKPKKDLSLNRTGWFRCWFSETLRSSVCEGGGLRMDPEKIKMSRGGEILEEVIGRREEEELPEFQSGAFQIDGGDGIGGEDQRLVTQEFLDEYVPRGVISKHTMRELIRSVRIVPTTELQCNEWIEEPTLLVTRFEYANLFHTFTDWYSAYLASRVTGLPNRPHLVFVDGHCRVFEVVKKARARGFTDVLFLDAATGKNIEEASTCNIFFVKDNVILTPPANGTVLPGITRKSIIEIARDLNYLVEELDVPLEDVLAAEEVFCTGTAVEVTAVASITYQDKRIEYRTGEETVFHKLRVVLNEIQTGVVEDKMGWTMLID